jgi:hypothetical protein
MYYLNVIEYAVIVDSDAVMISSNAVTISVDHSGIMNHRDGIGPV